MFHVYLDQTMKVFESTMAAKICVRYFSKTPPDSARGAPLAPPGRGVETKLHSFHHALLQFLLSLKFVGRTFYSVTLDSISNIFRVSTHKGHSLGF